MAKQQISPAEAAAAPLVTTPPRAAAGNPVTAFFVRFAERYMPDPFLFAIVLTLLTGVLAAIFVTTDVLVLIDAWYNGIWNILEFALQMILILLMGFAVARSPLVSRFLAWVAAKPRSQASALVFVLVVVSVASLINWGLALVTAGILAREIGKRLENVDYGVLVSAAYAGWMVFAMGISSPIPLLLSSPGNEQNFVQQATDQVLPFSQTVFAWWNVIPTVITIGLLIPLYLWMMPRRPEHMRKVNRGLLAQEDEVGKTVEESDTPAGKLERFWPFNVIIALAIFTWIGSQIADGTFVIDFNMMIATFLAFGMLLHWTPIRFIRAFTGSAMAAGPLALQYPFYGGIQGLMTLAVGGVTLASVMAGWFVSFSTETTLPFWSFISSILISWFIPSGGGHWVIQGPIMVPASETLGSSQALVSMSVAWGEGVANMVQPFWALPILSIVGLGIRDIMGYGVLVFALGAVVFGGFSLIAPIFL